ncbi:isochorismatase family protein [Actinokineospora xionganensis]|uniref:Isochorismatase family protein n=1 Tax=Actinokineospora xionganensis TaxID=2684470 RepID=A0ABR7KZX6_9PSEU|nr:isochorismatase family protein [Actinokineospora xionganensis]MBC6445978.1 isochorismatase family protein [Actinokineospora xionganensis]
MGIPTIEPYAMPTEDEIPVNIARWQPDPRRAVLLIHDMQRYFLRPFPPGESPVVPLVDNVRLLRDRCAALGVPVAYTAQPGGMTDEQRGLLKDFWGPGMTVSADHRKIVDGIEPAEGDHVFTKWRYSAFHRSTLLELLGESGRDQLIVCGVFAHVGCLMTACDAYTNDIETFLVADAIADFSREEHMMAVTYAAKRCAVTPMTASVLQMLGRPNSGEAGEFGARGNPELAVHGA